jgi:hypothetical protein
MGALFDQLTASGVEDEAPEQEEVANGEEEKAQVLETTAEAEPEPDSGEPEPEAKPEVVEAPKDLPLSIRDTWADMPESAREAVLQSHRSFSAKLAEQGRVVSASKPVFDVLVQAAQEIPTLQGMTPAQIATDVFKMAQIQGQFAQNPVGMLMGIAQQYGAVDGLKAALAGQPIQGQNQNAALVQEIKQLRAQLANVADPAAIEARVTETLTKQENDRMVMEYAASKEHWADVEEALPQFIAAAKTTLGAGASPRDILDAAYELAIYANPDLRAKQQQPAPQPVVADPARTVAQQKAKSVNLPPARPAAKPQLTEIQAMGAVWDRLRG